MVNLDNHNNHSNCEYYIYLTLGINERQGFLYVGQHKCKVKGEFDDNYFGSGLYIKRIEKKYGKDYIRDNFKCIPIWWCEDKEQADQMETFFIAEYETKEIGMNIADGGEGCYTIERRQQYYNEKFGNSEFTAYTKEEMDGFLKEEKKSQKKAYYEQNKEKKKAYKKAYQKAYYEQRKEEQRAYREQNKAKIKAKDKSYYEQNKEEKKAKNKAYYEQHKEEKNAYDKTYREQNKEELKAKKKAYYEQHKDEIKARSKAYRERKKLLNNT